MVLGMLVCVLGLVFGSVGFLTFRSDVRRAAGASTLTSALIYRKLRDESQLTRLQIKELRERTRSTRENGHRERQLRWKAQHVVFQNDLEKQKRS